jgi:hypothetical protein
VYDLRVTRATITQEKNPMTSRRPIAAVLLGAALSLAAGCSSAETRPPKRPVAEAEVPKPVLDQWARSYPSAKAAGWQERTGVYFVKGADSSRWLDVQITAAGAVKEAAEEATVDSVPAPVKSAFATSAYAKMTYVDSYKRIAPASKDYPTLYKFVLLDGEKPVIAVYDGGGKLVKQKDMTKEKLEKWRSEHVKPPRT